MPILEGSRHKVDTTVFAFSILFISILVTVWHGMNEELGFCLQSQARKCGARLSPSTSPSPSSHSTTHYRESRFSASRSGADLILCISWFSFLNDSYETISFRETNHRKILQRDTFERIVWSLLFRSGLSGLGLLTLRHT